MERLSELGVQMKALTRKEREALRNNWNLAFASQVKKERGVYVYLGFRWHAYSYGMVPCAQGKPALKTYLAQAPARFYLFDESMQICGICEAGHFPDLTQLCDDIYVVHHDLKWSMAFTHEQPLIGPFFAEGGINPNR